jgi:prepilin-type N-terminal cleavage/methylation domain-containing protein
MKNKIQNKIANIYRVLRAICYMPRVARNKGMTYVELIVVLSIFAVISSVTMFNYGSFQAKVDIKNLTSDIALKLVQAQKYSVSGKLPPLLQQGLIGGNINTWKPAYGVYFNTTSDANKKKFVYFTDIDSNNICDATCTSFFANGEFLEKIDINKGNFIAKLEIMDSNNFACAIPTGLTVLFRRPNSEAKFVTEPVSSCIISYIQITVSSSASTPVTSKILVYPSGRVEIK